MSCRSLLVVEEAGSGAREAVEGSWDPWEATSMSPLIGLYYFHPWKPPHFCISTNSTWYSLLKSHDHYPSILPRHSPITMNISRYQTKMHRLLLPIPDIADHDRGTKTATPAYCRIISYTTYSLMAATLLFP